MKEMTGRTWGKFLVWCFLVCSLTISAGVPVLADMGPKPGIHVKLVNAPAQGYCVGVLQRGERTSREEIETYADGVIRELMMKMYAYDKDGWQVDYGHGITSVCYSQGKTESSFYFYDIYTKQSVKLLVITEDGKEYVSNEIMPSRYTASLVFDLSTGKLSEDEEAYQNYDLKSFLQALRYLAATLLVEGLFLVLFRLHQARNLPIFFIANILTQAALHYDNWKYKIGHGGGWGLVGRSIVKEFWIIVVECILFAIFMKPKDGKKRWCVIYAIVANVVSGILGMIFSAPVGTGLAIAVILLIAFSLDTKRNVVIAMLIHIVVALFSEFLTSQITALPIPPGALDYFSVSFVRAIWSGLFAGIFIAIRCLLCMFLLQTKDESKGTKRKVLYGMVTYLTIWVFNALMGWNPYSFGFFNILA